MTLPCFSRAIYRGFRVGRWSRVRLFWVMQREEF